MRGIKLKPKDYHATLKATRGPPHYEINQARIKSSELAFLVCYINGQSRGMADEPDSLASGSFRS